MIVITFVKESVLFKILSTLDFRNILIIESFRLSKFFKSATCDKFRDIDFTEMFDLKL